MATDVTTEAPSAAAADAPVREPTPIEQSLIAVWRSLLNRSDISVDDEFFMLGGDSLKAVVLMNKVATDFGVAIPLNSIFDEVATIEKMARVIESTGGGHNDLGYAATLSDVVTMNAAGELPPLFAVGGRGGHSLGFAHVMKFLGPNQPFFGLDSVGLNGSDEPLTSIESIAADHIRRLRKVQPKGPFYLIGACFGGCVVYEMAQQLAGVGHNVGLVILLDPSPPRLGLTGARPSKPMSKARALREFVVNRLRLYASDLSELSWRDRYEYARQKSFLLRDIYRQGDLFRGDRTDLNQLAVHNANMQANRAYVATKYAGAAAVFWSQDREVASRGHRAEWVSLLQNAVSIEQVPGRDSGDMLRPSNAKILADKIGSLLHRIRNEKACGRL